MKRAIYALFAATIVAAIPLSAQNTAPVLNFDSAPTPLALPDDIYLGEVGGVATNSRGDIFVYTRTGHPTLSMATARPFTHGGSRLFQFDRNGKFGKPGKIAPGFQVVHKIDCRNPNELILGEIESWRVQKYILQTTAAPTAAGARR